MKHRPPPLTFEQIQAVRAYARQKGRNWQERLREDWQRSTAGAVLQGLRNTHGPKWLAAYKIKPLSGADTQYLQWKAEKDADNRSKKSNRSRT